MSGRRVPMRWAMCVRLVMMIAWLAGLAAGVADAQTAPTKEYIRLGGRVIAIESSASASTVKLLGVVSGSWVTGQVPLSVRLTGAPSGLQRVDHYAGGGVVASSADASSNYRAIWTVAGVGATAVFAHLITSGAPLDSPAITVDR